LRIVRVRKRCSRPSRAPGWARPARAPSRASEETDIARSLSRGTKLHTFFWSRCLLMKSIDSLPGIATTGHPRILHGPHVVGVLADRFGRPSGESWRGRADGPSSTRRRPGRYGWSADCRAMTERQLLECFVTANDTDAF